MVSTEEAAVLFGASLGLGGFLAQYLAAQRLSSVETDVPVTHIAIPIVVGVGGMAAASRLIPKK